MSIACIQRVGSGAPVLLGRLECLKNRSSCILTSPCVHESSFELQIRVMSRLPGTVLDAVCARSMRNDFDSREV